MPIDQLTRDLERHASFGEKYTGSPGDLATADWIAGELSLAGYQIQRQEIPLPCNRVSQLSLSDTGLTLFAQPNMVADKVIAPLWVVHDVAQASRAAGVIAVLALPYARYSTLWLPPIATWTDAATRAGAKAIIILPTGPSGDIVGLNTWADRPFADVPLVIGRPDELARYLALEGQEVTLTLLGGVDAVVSPNILAVRRAGPRWIALSTPRTGFFTCLTERGSGTAAFLAMARMLPARYPDHSLFVMNTTGHELAFAGTHVAMDSAPAPDATDLWVHIGATLAANDHQETRNGVMLRHADPNRLLMATPTMTEACRSAFAGLSGLEDPRPVISGAGELSSICDLGYRDAFAVLGQSRWFHTPQDTLDKLDPELLRPVITAHLAALDMALRAHHR